MVLGGLYVALIGFKVIKLKAKPEDQEKMDKWFQKFGTLMKICGILMIVLGLFLLETMIFDL
jgi:cytochrome c biogenesis protein CcdA